MNFNIDGTFGKKSLKQFKGIYAALLDLISEYDRLPDVKLRLSFAKQKQKCHKQASRNKNKNKENAAAPTDDTDDDTSAELDSLLKE